MTSVRGRQLSFTVRASKLVGMLEFSASSGEFTSIVGPNGSGKTTLLRLIAGLITPTSGVITFDGVSVDELGRDHLSRVRSYLSPDLPADIDFTVEEIVEMGRFPWATTRHEMSDAVERALTALNLVEVGGHRYSTLSTGEARLTHLARVLAQETDLLLLDEPTSGLDIAHAEQVHDTLSGLAHRGHTLIAVLHDLNAAARLSSHVVVMKRGQSRAQGPPAEVFTPALLSDVYEYPIDVARSPLDGGILVAPARSRKSQ